MARSTVLWLLTFLVGSLGATQVNFNKAGTIEAVIGERLSFNCSAPGNYIIELLEIGQTETIDEQMHRNPPPPGNSTSSYEPEDCQFDDSVTQCSKIVNITVTTDMIGKAYQCRSFRRGEDHTFIYSEGGHVQVRNIAAFSVHHDTAVTPSPSPTLPLAEQYYVSCIPTVVPTPEEKSPSLSTSDTLCECSAGIATVSHIHQPWKLILLFAAFLSSSY